MDSVSLKPSIKLKLQYKTVLYQHNLLKTENYLTKSNIFIKCVKDRKIVHEYLLLWQKVIIKIKRFVIFLNEMNLILNKEKLFLIDSSINFFSKDPFSFRILIKSQIFIAEIIYNITFRIKFYFIELHTKLNTFISLMVKYYIKKWLQMIRKKINLNTIF